MRSGFFVLLISVFTAILGLAIVAPLMAVWATSLGATGFYLGLIFSAYAASRAVFNPLFGRLSDKQGRKRYLLTGILGTVAISLVYLVAKQVWSLTLVRLLHGVMSAMIIPIAMAYAGDLAPPRREGVYMGTFTMAMFIGMGMGPILGGSIFDHLSIETAFITLDGMDMVFIILGGLALLNSGLVFFFLPDITPQRKRSALLPLTQLIREKPILAIVIFRMTNAMGRSVIMVFIPLLALQNGYSLTQIGGVITVNILVTALLQAPFGRLADRWDKINLIIMGNFVGAAGLFLIPFCNNIYILFAVMAVTGLGGAVSIPSGTAINAILGRKRGMGAVMGLFNTAMSAGLALGPLLMGAVMSYWNLDVTFFAAGGLVLLGTTAFIVMVWAFDLREVIRRESAQEAMEPAPAASTPGGQQPKP